MTSSRQPTSSPSTLLHNTTQHGPRELVVKLDASDEPGTMYLHSTENINDFTRPSPIDDQRRQTMPYEHRNPQLYQPPPPEFPAPSPFRHPRSESPLKIPDSYNRGNVYSYKRNAASSASKIKALRKSQACDTCRAAKARCSESKPCATCRSRGVECVFQPAVPKQEEKVQADILTNISAVQRAVDQLNDKLDRMEQKHNGLEEALIQLVPGLKSTLEQASLDVKRVKEEKLHHDSKAIPDEPIPSTETTQEPDLQDVELSPLEDIEGEEDMEDGKLVPPAAVAIPLGHSTGAVKLLKWKAIDAIIGAKLKQDNIVFNVTRTENRRGLLRLYGWGEGQERISGYEKDVMIDSLVEDNYISTASPIRDGTQWGQLPAPSQVTTARQERQGEVIMDILDIDAPTVYRLVQSFKDNINNMHPIVTNKRINELVKTFLRCLPEKQKPAFVDSCKRKRSPDARGRSDIQLKRYTRPQKNISTAIVLLILALGSVCEHKEKLPEVGREQNKALTDPLTASNDFSRSPNTASSLPQQPAGLQSPVENSRSRNRIRRASRDGIMPPRSQEDRRNSAVIPGLAFFATATDIIGNQLAGATLPHVQAHILASLYHGQLARTMESFAYIANAGRALQAILLPKLERFQNCTLNPESEKTRDSDNPLLFLYWICMQLESDLLAELDVPQSGILALEANMPWPNLALAVESGDMTIPEVQSYIGQLKLRKTLNGLHRDIYAPGVEEEYRLVDLNQRPESAFPHIAIYEESLQSVKEYATDFAWAEDDPPATDLLSARIRAKFYGGRVILYRPYLKLVLNNQFMPPGERVEQISTVMLEFAHRAIRALVESSCVFMGLPNNRLIVTNVFGTAHAQWGNVLALQAAYRDPVLHAFVDADRLRNLTARVRDFISYNAQPGSALRIDLKILDHAAAVTGFSPAKDPGSSFSSGSAGDAANPMARWPSAPSLS